MDYYVMCFWDALLQIRQILFRNICLVNMLKTMLNPLPLFAFFIVTHVRDPDIKFDKTFYALLATIPVY